YTCASLTSTSPAPPCVSTLSLHDALPISRRELPMHCRNRGSGVCSAAGGVRNRAVPHSQRRGASGDHGAVCVSGAWGLLASHEACPRGSVPEVFLGAHLRTGEPVPHHDRSADHGIFAPSPALPAA